MSYIGYNLRRAAAWFLSRDIPDGNILALQFALYRGGLQPNERQPPTDGPVLVLAPHMDDETLGCGGTVLNGIAAGMQATAVLFSDGRKGYLPSIEFASDAERDAFEEQLVERRKAEALAAIKILGLQEAIFLDFTDGQVGDFVDEAADKLAAELRRIRPTTVFLPFLLDAHVDHKATSDIFFAAASRSGLADDTMCWGYEVWTPLVPNTIVDITEYVDTKRRAIAEYVSQLECLDYDQASTSLSAYRGIFLLSGGTYAEAFVVAPYRYYRELHEMLVRPYGDTSPVITTARFD